MKSKFLYRVFFVSLFLLVVFGIVSCKNRLNIKKFINEELARDTSEDFVSYDYYAISTTNGQTYVPSN
ncbi:MAG: hypothetical protein P1P64_02160 [Treponemataceae bacterium]